MAKNENDSKNIGLGPIDRGSGAERMLAKHGGRIYAENSTPERVLWRQITEAFGYKDILHRRDKSLHTLARMAAKYDPSYDPFCELRRRDHEFEFDPYTVLFLKPSIRNGEFYRALSGWHMKQDPIHYAGEEWKSLEHAYQASKYAITMPETAQRIQRASIPLKAKSLGDRNSEHRRSDWNGVKDLAMLGPALAISRADTEVRTLFDTLCPNIVIVEDSINDRYWGRGPISDGKCLGESKLGCTWMLARNIVESGQGAAIQSEIEGLFVQG